MRENYNYHSLDEVKQFAKNVGCKCLDIEYKNDKFPMTFIPSCGHGIIKMSYKYLRIGRYYQLCEKCRKEYHKKNGHINSSRLIPFSKIKENIESTGCKLHSKESEYYNTHDSILDIELTCGCHKKFSYHKWDGYLNNPKRYNHALICKNHYWKNYRLEEIEKNGCKFISGDIQHDMAKIVIQCKCGHQRETTFNAFKYSKLYYCVNCSNNHLSEQLLYKIIKEKFPDTEYQHTIFTDRYQWIDYFIPSKNVAIEYHGGQHFEQCKWFHKSKEQFLRAVEMDKIKEKWCKENCNRYIIIDGRKWNKSNFNSNSFKEYIDFLLNSF